MAQFTSHWNAADKNRKMDEDERRLAILMQRPRPEPSILVHITSPILHTAVDYHSKHVICSGKFPRKARFAVVTIDVTDPETLTMRMPKAFRESVRALKTRQQFIVGGCITTLLQDEVDMQAMSCMDIDVIGTGPNNIKNMKVLFVEVIINYCEAHRRWGPIEEYEYVLSRTADGMTLTLPGYRTGCEDQDPYSYVVRSGRKFTRPLVLQFINRDYSDLEHALTGFDLPACCVAFNGDRVLALPRGYEALRTGSNLVDDDRQSLTFEKRLLKYMYVKGFDIVLPGIDVMQASMISPFQDVGNRMEKFVGEAFHMKAKISRAAQHPEGGSYAGGLRFDLFGNLNTVKHRAYSAAETLTKSGVKMVIVTAMGSSDTEAQRMAVYDMDDPACRVDLLIASMACVSERSPVATDVVHLPFGLVPGDGNSFRGTREGSLYD